MVVIKFVGIHVREAETRCTLAGEGENGREKARLPSRIVGKHCTQETPVVRRPRLESIVHLRVADSAWQSIIK